MMSRGAKILKVLSILNLAVSWGAGVVALLQNDNFFIGFVYIAMITAPMTLIITIGYFILRHKDPDSLSKRFKILLYLNIGSSVLAIGIYLVALASLTLPMWG